MFNYGLFKGASMSHWALIIWGASGTLLIVILVYELVRYIRQVKRSPSGNSSSQKPSTSLLLGSIGLLVFILMIVVSSNLPSGIEAKGDSGHVPWTMVGLMYLAMVLGIVAQSFYFSGTTSLPSTWVKPVLASPIVFIPLVSSYQSSLLSMNGISLAELMILLVSFQNGFFWKVIFDKQSEALGNQNK
jgi:hypothetical protein